MVDIRYDLISLPKTFPFSISVMNLPPYNDMGGYFHWHDCFEISIITQGFGTYDIENKHYPVKASDIVIINNIEPHRLLVGKEGLTQIVTIFKPELIWSANNLVDYDYIKPFIERDVNFKNLIENSEEISKKIIEIIEIVMKEYECKQDGWQLMIKSQLLSLLTLLFRHYKSDIPNKKTRNNLLKLKDAFEYIDHNFDKEISLTHTAQMLHFTPQYFSKFFSETTGVPFKQYITNIRINHAKQLLRNTDLKIIDVAAMCGFNNIGNFYTIFKNNTGTTPTEIRNK